MSLIKQVYHRFYLISGFLLILLQTHFIFSAPIAITAELFFFPWLIQKGLLPYRDFFDHHGILLYYLLAPLTQNTTFIFLYIFYYILQTVNLLLTLLLLRPLRSKPLFIFGGFWYVIVSFFINDNLLWFEQFITVILLVTVHLLRAKDTRYKPLILGSLIALASLIKPTAAIFVVPLYIFTKKTTLFIPLVLTWLGFVGIFFFLGSFDTMISNLFLFNRYILPAYFTNGLVETRFIILSISIGISAFVLYFISKRTKEKTILLAYVLTSAVFLPPHFPKVHLFPLTTFFTILTVYVLREFPWNRSKKFFILATCLSFVVFMYSEKKAYSINRDHQVVFHDETSNQIVYWIKEHPETNSIFLFGNKVEVYQQADHLPPTYFPIKLPFMQLYYPDYEQRVIADIQRSTVDTVIIPIPIEKGFTEDRSILNYILENFTLFEETETFRVYKKP